MKDILQMILKEITIKIKDTFNSHEWDSTYLDICLKLTSSLACKVFMHLIASMQISVLNIALKSFHLRIGKKHSLSMGMRILRRTQRN